MHSFSNKLLPTSRPFAATKVLAIAPPIIIISIFLSKKFITSILVETFDPPIIAATGLLGLFKTLSKALISFSK